MANTFEKRRQLVAPILARYHELLIKNGRIGTFNLEKEFKDALQKDYGGVRDFMQKLAEKEPLPVLLYYFEHESPTGPKDNVKPILAKAYGVPNYDQPGTDAAKKSFWERFVSGQGD